MNILGIYTGHDLSACLLRNGEIVTVIEEERLTRVKHGIPKPLRGLWDEFNGHFGYFPWAAVSYCLEAGGIGLDELDAIVLPEDARSTAMASMLPLKDRRRIIVSDEPAGGVHHYRHALSGFLASTFDSAAVLVVDGDGTWVDGHYEAETGYLFKDRGGGYREIFKNRYKPRSSPDGVLALYGGLGFTYEYISALLGFVNTKIGYMAEPGKTMGLAPYGRPNPELAAPWVTYDGFGMDFSRFHEWLCASGMHKLVSFDSREKALVQNEEEISSYARDLAYKVQQELERAMLHLAEQLHAATQARNLCLAGGVALNSVANGLILKQGPFENVFVQPAAADNGQAIGLAYYGHQKLSGRNGKQRIRPIRHAFGGKPYPARQVRELLETAELPFEEFPDDAALLKDTVSQLRKGRILGWFQGGSEYGPRALGHRSILVDPRDPGMKDYLNARVKFREPFRPFAPSVPLERASEIFELRGESPYMLIVAPVRDEWRERIPSIVHVDGTARVQTVDREVDPLYHGLITAFGAATGVPVLLNTSFNLRGMPVVESPLDALKCFLYTEMDALYLGRFKVTHPSLKQTVLGLSPGWLLIVEQAYAAGKQRRRARLEHEGAAGKKRTVPLPNEEELVQLCAALDGKRSLAQALSAAGIPRPSKEEAARYMTFAQTLLRSGAMRLRAGTLDI